MCIHRKTLATGSEKFAASIHARGMNFA